MSPPIRVLHAVGGMNRGGTETWLMNTLRNTDSQAYQFTFMKTDSGPHAFDTELDRLGARAVVCDSPRSLNRFVPALAGHLRSAGYDVVHSHLHLYSGIVLGVAQWCGVKVRIAHAHTDTRAAPAEYRPLRRAYASLMRGTIRSAMTHGLAVSEGAAASLFGANFQADGRIAQFACGIDLAAFRNNIDRQSLRAKYGIPLGAKVVGHVGRFEAPKNHAFLLKVMKKLMDEDQDVWLVLVGDGALRRSIEQLADGLAPRVTFVGSVPDVPELLNGVFDAFAFPSAWEGLGLAVVEAQAAGLSCVVSDAVPANAIVNRSLVRVVELAAPISSWVEAVKHALVASRPDRELALSHLEGGPFDIAQSTAALCRLYQAAHRREVS